jgi:hypothetical protein
MKLTASKRVSRLEVKSAGSIEALAEAQRKMKIAAREKWRQDNHGSQGWQLFLSLYGPDSDYYKFDPDPEDPRTCEETVAQIAYSEQFRDILKHYEGDTVNYGPMKGPYLGAFAFAIELFYGTLDSSTLLETFLHQYGGDLPAYTPLIDLAKMKIEESGLEWMQISYSDEMQQSLEESLFGEFLSENFMM